MASSSPSQGLAQKLTVALIVFIIFALTLAATSYLFFRKADENFKLLEARQKELDEEKSKRLEAVNQRRELVRDVLGLPEDLDNAEILRRRKTTADDASGRGAAAPQERSAREMTEPNRTRPGVIRTHDQGIMSPLL